MCRSCPIDKLESVAHLILLGEADLGAIAARGIVPFDLMQDQRVRVVDPASLAERIKPYLFAPDRGYRLTAEKVIADCGLPPGPDAAASLWRYLPFDCEEISESLLDPRSTLA